MRFSIPILAVGIATSGLWCWGQNAGSLAAGSAESYRQRLKANASDSSTEAASSTGKLRESYREALRQLAEGDENAASQSTEIPKSETERAGQTGRANPTVDMTTQPNSLMNSISDVPLLQQDAVQPVSMQKNYASQAPSLPVVIPMSSSCDGEYCKQLRRIADGATMKTSAQIYEPGRTPTTEANFLKNLAFDQMHIWTSPFKLRDGDATWAVPFAIVTGSLIATDRDISKQLSNPGRIDTSKQVSNLGLYSFIGAGAGMYGLGLISHNDHQRETGLLAGEAFINATLVTEALKAVVGRQRPFEGDHFGHIGKGGSSFPSGHAIDSWAIATVLAHEYPTPFMQIASYGLASAVSVARITAQQHYASDVLVGSAFGYFIGRKIYRDHHNPELPGAEYGTFVRERPRGATHSGSAYVPLESWVYRVIDRLAALGFVRSNFDSERPFTRLECARIAAEAAENADLYDASPDMRSMVTSLRQEFARESEVWAGNSDNRSLVLESVYTRAIEIAGPVLRDGYHFGQTLYNDYGRPYGRGFNSITGFSARATSGPLVFYFRGEYQHAPATLDYSSQVKAQITAAEAVANLGTGPGTPQLNNPFPAEDRFRVLDAYVGLNLGNSLLTLGPQSLWWGPGTGGPFMFTNNSEPLNMIRLNSTSPTRVPLLSKFLGPLRYDIFLGQTDGQHYVFTSKGLIGPDLGTQPFVQGQRFSFKPTPNFEFGLTKTGIFGGTGYPLTAGYLFRTTFTSANYTAGDAKKPGDRRSGFDMTYRIPRLRDRLTWYAEEFSEDETSPLLFPRMSAMRSGIYAAKLPWLPRVDLRVEGVYTDVPSYGAGKGYFYFNATYRDGFTKNGNIIGDWIGRDGRGVSAASTIWLSAKNSFQLGYREAVVDHEFLQGGRYQNFSIGASLSLRSNIQASAAVQYEHWAFPILSAFPQNNVSSSIQLIYMPDHLSFPRGGNK